MSHPGAILLSSDTEGIGPRRQRRDVMSGVTGIDGTIEATPVRAEACAAFRGSEHDPLVCGCGWLEHDHGELAARRLWSRSRKVGLVTPERRAS
jgi:hypothetical protein